MQKKVVITIGSLDAGGCERRLHRILQQVRIHDIDLDFTFFIVSGRRGQLDDEYESLGATIRYGRPGVAGLVDLWRLCREVQPDVLHVNGQLASGVYCLAGLLAGVRNRVSFLATVGRGRPVAFDPMSSILHAMLTRALSTQVVGVADATRKYSLVPDRKWKTIYSGVNLPNLTNRKLDGYPSERLNILVLGRSDPQKNHYRALKIFSNLINSGVDAHLHFVGLRTDVRMAELCVEIKRMGIADRMTAHGYSSNVYSHREFGRDASAFDKRRIAWRRARSIVVRPAGGSHKPRGCEGNS